MSHIICHESEVANDGDFVCLPWGVDKEVVVSNMGGELVAWDNRCPHRGARIHTTLRGNARPVCGYHGRCAQAAQVRRYESRKLMGSFVATKDVNVFSGIAGPTTALRLFSELHFVMDCHWTVAIENALDSEHIPTVHSGSLNSLGLAPNTSVLRSDGSSVEVFNSAASKKLDALSKIAGWGWAGAGDYQHAHIFPYTCISSTRGLTYSLQNYFPRADGRTNFFHRLYVSETARDLTHYFNSVAAMNRQVFEEDAAICALVAPWHPTKWSPSESRLAHFRHHAEILECAR